MELLAVLMFLTNTGYTDSNGSNAQYTVNDSYMLDIGADGQPLTIDECSNLAAQVNDVLWELRYVQEGTGMQVGDMIAVCFSVSPEAAPDVEATN